MYRQTEDFPNSMINDVECGTDSPELAGDLEEDISDDIEDWHPVFANLGIGPGEEPEVELVSEAQDGFPAVYRVLLRHSTMGVHSGYAYLDKKSKGLLWVDAPDAPALPLLGADRLRGNKPVVLLSDPSLVPMLWDCGVDAVARVRGGLNLQEGELAPLSNKIVFLASETSEAERESLATKLLEMAAELRPVHIPFRILDHYYRSWLAGGENVTENVREILRTAITCQRESLPPGLVWPLPAFLGLNDASMPWLIEGLLPVGGCLLVSGEAKLGKSLFVLEMAFHAATGDCAWLGYEFGPAARVLYVQGELSDPMLRDRARLVLGSAPETVNRHAAKNLFCYSIANGPPRLALSASSNGADVESDRDRVEKMVRGLKIDILIVDPFAACFPGLDENSARDVSEALSWLTGLANRNSCAVILVHHLGKGDSRQPRGSSVFMGWPDADLRLWPRGDGTAKARYNLRAAAPWPDAILRLPSKGEPWFQETDEEDSGGDDKDGGPGIEAVAEAVAGLGGTDVKSRDLHLRLEETTGFGEGKRKRLMSAAVDAEVVISPKRGLYSLPLSGQDGVCDADQDSPQAEPETLDEPDTAMPIVKAMDSLK